MHGVHRRNGQGRGDVVAWISDGTRPFVIVLIQQPGLKDRPLGPIGHLGVACASREDIDRLAARAAEAGILLKGPEDWGAPVGYWAYIADPDGNVLEISHGQQVELTVENRPGRSEEHTSEPPSLMRISYAVICLKKKINKNDT